MPGSRNHHSKLKIRTWALYILPIYAVNRADTFWIGFFNIFKYFSVQIASAVNKYRVMQTMYDNKDIKMWY